MAKNWLGSEVGRVVKTVTIPANYSGYVTENGRKIVKAGSLITDTTLGSGLLVNDADITDGARVGSMMIRGTYINANLPVAIPTTGDGVTVSSLALQGLYNIAYPANTVQFGEVTD